MTELNSPITANEADFLPMSALQHLRFCERQCALIHIEQMWEENRLTAEGRQLHSRVHERGTESRRNLRVEFSVRLRSVELALAGIADVVEYHRRTDGTDHEYWLPFPVEYKRGKRKPDTSDEVQLCAQAIALEEMTGCTVPDGAIFYGRERKRKIVQFTDVLRKETAALAVRLHALLHELVLPAPVNDTRCDRCSLRDVCMPESIKKGKNVRGWFERHVIEGDDT